MANRQRMLKVDTCVFMDPDTARFWVRACGWVYYESGRQWVDEMVPCPEGATRKEARELHRQILADRRAGFWFPDRYAVTFRVPRLAQLVETILTDKADPTIGARRERTIEHWRQSSRHWLDELGDFPVDRITAVDVELWWKRFLLREGLANTTKNRSLSYLATVLDRAIALGYRSNNPARSVERLRPERKVRREAITIDAWRAIYTALEDWDERSMEPDSPGRGCYMGHAPYAFVQVALAARGAEVCGINRHTDLSDELVTFRDTKTGPTLTRDLTATTRAVIDRHIETMQQYSDEAMVQSPWLFPSRTGERATPSSRIRKAWKYAMQQVKGNWVPHDLRRLGIRLLYDAGGERHEVMEWVGHRTADAHAVYLRAEPERRKALAEGLTEQLLKSR